MRCFCGLNQWGVGWELLNPVPFTASWNGKDGLDAIKIRFHGEPSPLIGSHFGHGVLTFTPGYLFRTTKSHNLYVKGPANRPKDGIAALEGLIQKYYLQDTQTGEYAGIYHWASKEALTAYRESALRKSIAAAYQAEGEPRIEVYRVIRPLRP